MTEKEKLVKEIAEFPIEYAKMWGFDKDGEWDVDKLKFTELSILINYHRDIKTIERNKKLLNGKQD